MMGLQLTEKKPDSPVHKNKQQLLILPIVRRSLLTDFELAADEDAEDISCHSTNTVAHKLAHGLRFCDMTNEEIIHDHEEC